MPEPAPEPKPPEQKEPKKKTGGGGINPIAVAAGALVAGILVAKFVDWRGHAHPRSEPAGLGESAKQIAEHASALARLELRLAGRAQPEGKVFAVGIALALAALLLLLYALDSGSPRSPPRFRLTPGPRS